MSNGNGTQAAITQQKTTMQGIQVSAGTGIVFQNLEEAWMLAQTFAKGNLVPDTLREKPSDVLYIIMAGMELGWSPIRAFQNLHIIKGKVTMASAAKAAMCMNSPLCEYWTVIENTEKVACIEAKRKGYPKPNRVTFTIDDAQRAGLLGNENYKKYPKRMLLHRCESDMAETLFPDLVRGFASSEAVAEEPLPTLERVGVSSVFAPPPPPTASAAQGPAVAPMEVVDPVTGEVSPAPTAQPMPPAKAEPMGDSFQVIMDEIPACQTAEEVDGLANRATKLELSAEERQLMRSSFKAKREEIARRDGAK